MPHAAYDLGFNAGFASGKDRHPIDYGTCDVIANHAKAVGGPTGNWVHGFLRGFAQGHKAGLDMASPDLLADNTVSQTMHEIYSAVGSGNGV